MINSFRQSDIWMLVSVAIKYSPQQQQQQQQTAKLQGQGQGLNDLDQKFQDQTLTEQDKDIHVSNSPTKQVSKDAETPSTPQVQVLDLTESNMVIKENEDRRESLAKRMEFLERCLSE